MSTCLCLKIEISWNEISSVRPGTGKIWTVEGDEKLDQKMEEGDLKRSFNWIQCDENRNGRFEKVFP